MRMSWVGMSPHPPHSRALTWPHGKQPHIQPNHIDNLGGLGSSVDNLMSPKPPPVGADIQIHAALISVMCVVKCRGDGSAVARVAWVSLGGGGGAHKATTTGTTTRLTQPTLTRTPPSLPSTNGPSTPFDQEKRCIVNSNGHVSMPELCVASLKAPSLPPSYCLVYCLCVWCVLGGGGGGC